MPTLQLGFNSQPQTLQAQHGLATIEGPPATFVTNASTLKPLGNNLTDNLAYYGTEQPFLNILKSGGQASGHSGGIGWITGTAISTGDTIEASLLNLDANQYPVQIPQPGLTSTVVFCYVCWSIATVPGAATAYPAGVYRLQFTGKGTVVIEGADASAGSGTGGSGLTFTNATNGTVTGTFTASGLCSGGAGFRLNISSSNPLNDGNNVRAISIVQNSLAASFDAGAIYHPNFLASVANLSTLRFKDWLRTDTGELHRTNALNAVLLGNTNLVLGFNWGEPSGTYPVLFDDGQLINGTMTFGSANVTLASGVTKAISAGQLLHVVTFRRSWATRSQPGWAFYTTGFGVPYETCIALCNLMNIHPWVNPPLTADDTYHTNMATLFHTTLNSNLVCYPQISNETWNSGFQQYAACYSLGNGAFAAGLGSQNDYQLNYNGMRTAVMAELWKAAWGADFNRCFPVYGSAVGSTYTSTQALNSPFWTAPIDGFSGPATAHPIKCVAIAPYFPIQGGIPGQVDANKMLAQADGGLDYFFQSLYSNIMVGGSAPGALSAAVPANGILGQTLHGGGGFAGIDGHLTVMAASYPTLNLVAYEGGNQFDGQNPSGTTPGIYTWQQLCNVANRDARMNTAYLTYLNYWNAHVGGTQANINITFNHCDSYSRFSWGAIESVMQLANGFQPQRYIAEHTYIGA